VTDFELLGPLSLEQQKIEIWNLHVAALRKIHTLRTTNLPPNNGHSQWMILATSDNRSRWALANISTVFNDKCLTHLNEVYVLKYFLLLTKVIHFVSIF